MAHGGKREGAGRKKARHTIEAEAGKAELIRAYLENIRPINEALIKKAKRGDMEAIKELHNRVYGKAVQPLATPDGPLRLAITFDDAFARAATEDRG
jgi:hypothetical protein